MPEVLRVLARMNVGGPARHVIRIDAPLRRRGWHSVLVTGRPGPGEGDLVDEARQAGVEVVVLDTFGRAIRPLADARTLSSLRALLAERRPAIVHTHTAKAGLLGRRAVRGGPPRPARVHTFHGHVLSGYFAAPVAALLAAAERRLARRTDGLVAVAERVRDELLHEHGVGRPEQWSVIPPGIDFARVAPDRPAGAALRAGLGVPHGSRLFGFVGRLEPIKALDVLLDAWQAVSARQGDVHLLVVGDGAEGEAVRQRMAALPACSWLPPRAALGPVYGAIDALLLPSRAEGCPQVVVEALAAGLPVVASAVGGVPELLAGGPGAGPAGLLVPPGDARALADAIGRLADEPGLAERLAAGAAAADLSAHAPEAVAERLAALYDGLRLENGVGQAQTARPCISSS